MWNKTTRAALVLALGAAVLLQGQVAYALPPATDDQTATTQTGVDDPVTGIEQQEPVTPSEEAAPIDQPPVAEPAVPDAAVDEFTPQQETEAEVENAEELEKFEADPNLRGDVDMPVSLEMSRSMSRAAAASLPSAGFKAGNIISDANMYSRTALSVSQIQTLLNREVPLCTINHPNFPERKAGKPFGGTTVAANCLRDMRATTQSRAANSYCNAYAGAKNETAAQIIAKVSAACGVSSKVLIVRLQLEQSLITDDWPTVRQYSFAMGWNCPDSGPGNSANCNNGSAGFLDQVYGSAWQIKRYQALPNEYRYKANKTNAVQWHPNASCGTSNVFIENQATAALYIYTPYRPNQAALNAGWNAADNACATYGNRNFYQYYRAWFGTPNTFFSDVVQGHQYFTEIEWMGASGMSSGTQRAQGLMYEPLNGTTRRAMAAFLYRLSGSPAVKLPSSSPFSDVKPGDAFYKEIVWMRQQGLANGYKKAGSKPEYRPMTTTTRSAMAAFMFRMTPEAKSFKAPAVSPFTDIPKSHQFYREISWMRTEGLSFGYASTGSTRVYKPKTQVTRQAMAAFMYRLKH